MRHSRGAGVRIIVTSRSANATAAVASGMGCARSRPDYADFSLGPCQLQRVLDAQFSR